jgi:aspartokinase
MIPDSSSQIVCKFGGTSLADAVQIRKVADIVRADPRRRFVVVSAPGKRSSNDQKITDLLLTCWHLATQKLHYQEPLSLIRERYDQIARDLNVPPVAAPLLEMQSELSKLASGDTRSLATRDWMAARGEYFHACLIADFLGAQFVPSGDCIRFDAEGLLDESSYANLAARMSDDGLYVIPGFYGRDTKGRIKTFPRGGSDITGAVVARAVGAAIYENWTDVSGLLMADPRVVKNPSRLRKYISRVARVSLRRCQRLARRNDFSGQRSRAFPFRFATPTGLKMSARALWPSALPPAMRLSASLGAWASRQLPSRSSDEPAAWFRAARTRSARSARCLVRAYAFCH